MTRPALPGPGQRKLPEGGGVSLLSSDPLDGAVPVDLIVAKFKTQLQPFPTARIQARSVRAWDFHYREENKHTGQVRYFIYDTPCWLVTISNVDFYGRGLDGGSPNHEKNFLFDQLSGEELLSYSFR